MRIPLLGKALSWLLEAIVGKAARDLNATDPIPLRNRPVEWHQRHAQRTVGDLLERQRRDEIPPSRPRSR